VLEPGGITRARAYAAIDRALERSRSASRDRERGQTTLFGMFDQARGANGGSTAGDEYPAQAVEWDKM
jgi:DNA polymerase-3 subunit alpha